MSLRSGWMPALVAGALVVASACSDESVAPDSAEPTPIDGSVSTDMFTTITARITETDGEVCEVCVWLADTPDERGRGLMWVTTLGDAAGMVFEFEAPVAGVFYMFQTPTPLSIAWFDSDGDHVGSADMAPCLDTPAEDCQLYSPGVEYELALETFEGGLEPLGIGPGARLELLDGTESDRCPLAVGPTP